MSQPEWGKWGTWEEAEACVGKVVGTQRGADPVELGSIRRWLEPKQFDCPLHFDEQVARQAGYEGIIAPSTMAFTYGLGAYWQPGDALEQPGDTPRQIPIPVIFDVPAPCTLSFATSVTLECLAPMCLGDRLTITSRLTSLKRKTLRVGDGAFFQQQDTYTNQRGETVAVALLDIFRFSPPKEDDHA